MPPTTLLRAKCSITLHEHVHVHILMPGRLACSCLLVCLLCLQTVTGINDSAPQRHDSISNRITHYWKELSRICPSHNYTSCWHVDRSNWTDASRVQTTGASVAPLGDWSTFQLITYDGHGTRRVTGGDSWSIVLKGVGTNNLTVPARVFDEGDGTYTVAALLLRPATYSMIARLFYSNCLGLQSAAGSLLDWGRHLEYKDHCYIGKHMCRATSSIAYPQYRYARIVYVVMACTGSALQRKGASLYACTCSNINHARQAGPLCQLSMTLSAGCLRFLQR